MEHTHLKQDHMMRVALAAGINALAVPVLIAGTVGDNMESFATGFRAAMRSVVGTSICQSCEVEVVSIVYDTARDSAMAWLGAAAALAAVGAAQKGIRRLALIGAGVAVVQAAGCDAIAKGIDRVMSGHGDDDPCDPDDPDTGPAPTWN